VVFGKFGADEECLDRACPGSRRNAMRTKIWSADEDIWSADEDAWERDREQAPPTEPEKDQD
jgi:hypothetical protein